jgi:hypothetical protein
MSSAVGDLECRLIGQVAVIILENDAAAGLSSKARIRTSIPSRAPCHDAAKNVRSASESAVEKNRFSIVV